MICGIIKVEDMKIGKRGLLEMLELNKIYNMDCVQGMKLLDDCSVDLTVTSPPYDNLRTYKRFEWNFKATAKELYRVTKQGGVVVWIVGDATVKGSETGTSFKQALYFKEIGFNLHDTMIWFKPNCFNFGSNNCYKQSFEYMFVFSKGKPKAINLIKDIPNASAGKVMKGGRKHSDGSRDIVPNFVGSEYKRRFNVWSINVSAKTYGHPAIFPEQLAKDHIVSWSNEGDVVLDPFLGSGTTAKMALLNNRNFIGFELNPEYCKMAEKRIEPYLMQQTIFELLR
jgi:site-specific DNA-methyltransferase (adenine-specific)